MKFNSTENTETAVTNENVVAGTVGSLLFAIAGGILWFVLYQIGYISSFVGFIGIFCAVKGYTFFAKTKQESTRCIVLSAIMTVLVLMIAWYFGIAYDIYSAYRQAFAVGESDFTLTFFESIRAVSFFLEDQELLSEYLKDLGDSLFYAALGVVYYLIRRHRIRKQMGISEDSIYTGKGYDCEDAEDGEEEACDANTDNDADAE